MLSWSEPVLAYGIIIKYTVQCLSQNIAIVETAHNQIILTDLKPYTNYTCSIAASATEVGIGPEDTKTQQTHEDGI